LIPYVNASHVEPLEAIYVRKDVDLDDPATADRERHDRVGPSPSGTDDAGGAVHEDRASVDGKARKAEDPPRHRICTSKLSRPAAHRAEVGPDDDVRIEHREQRPEVTFSRGGVEGVNDRSLPLDVGIRDRCSAHAPPRTAGQLARGRGRPADYWRDLVERQAEDVVEDEGHALSRGKGIEHHEQRESDGIAQQRRLLGVNRARAAYEWLGHRPRQWLLATRPSCSQRVETHAGDDRDQSSLEVVDCFGV
jgi:hypothetical protein